MLRVMPFQGVRYDWRRVSLGRAVCPPYDVIPPGLGRRLRRLAHNAIHIESPEGGPSVRYRRAAAIWRRWRKRGVLVQEARPVYYVVEQKFSIEGRTYRRTGILAALGLDRRGLSRVVPHERTFPKPKADRLAHLRSVRANTSPIFTLYQDPRGTIRALLARRRRRAPDAAGPSRDGVRLRVWRVDDPATVGRLERLFRGKRLLIADGHHRMEVSRAFGADSILCYLCAEEDPGLVVLPTHRVLRPGGPPESQGAQQRLLGSCRMSGYPSLPALERALKRHPSSLAFGVVSPGNGRPYRLAVPRPGHGGGSRLGVEWLHKALRASIEAGGVAYTHDAREAAQWARRAGGVAFLVKALPVREIRRAVSRLGLLPQKSTYFFPKVQAGLVFKTLG